MVVQAKRRIYPLENLQLSLELLLNKLDKDEAFKNI